MPHHISVRWAISKVPQGRRVAHSNHSTIWVLTPYCYPFIYPWIFQIIGLRWCSLIQATIPARFAEHIINGIPPHLKIWILLWVFAFLSCTWDIGDQLPPAIIITVDSYIRRFEVPSSKCCVYTESRYTRVSKLTLVEKSRGDLILLVTLVVAAELVLSTLKICWKAAPMTWSAVFFTRVEPSEPISLISFIVSSATFPRHVGSIQ